MTSPPLSPLVTERPERNFLQELWDAKTARVLFTALVFVLVLAFLHGGRETLTLFLFAILFAYFLAPAVGKLQGVLRGRRKAILVVYLVLGAVLVGLGFLIGPNIADEARELASSLPSLLDRLGSGQLVAELGKHYHWKQARTEQAHVFLTSHRAEILNYGKVAGAKLAAPVQKIWWLILIPILSLFFLNDGEDIATNMVKLGRSTKEKSLIEGLLNDINVMLGSYIRAQVILAGMTLVAYTLVLGILRVPYAFILGPVAGFLEFIPVVGPAIAAASVLLIAILAGYPHAVWLFLFLGAWRIAQDYVNAPRIMGQSLEINPLMQIFAVLAGAEIAGVVGALISVPVVAILRIIGRRIVVRQEGNPEPTATAYHASLSKHEGVH